MPADRSLPLRALAFCGALLVCATAASGGNTNRTSRPYPAGGTIFVLPGEDGPVVGKSHGAQLESGLLIVNKRGSAKKGYGIEHPVEWTSMQGSVTFTQYSRDFAWGGINEAGLVIEMLLIMKENAMEYPKADNRPAIRPGQWVQYQLDTAASVDDVVASDGNIRIGNSPRPKLTVHYLVADARGDCAVVEFIGGKLVAFRGDDLVAKALSNTMYSELAATLRQHDLSRAPLPDFRGMPPETYAEQSVARFLHAASMTTAYNPKMNGPAGNYALKTLEALQCTGTQWTVIYDIPGRRVVWRTASAPDEKHLGFSNLDLSATAPVLCIDVASKATGDASGALIMWTHDINSELIRSTSSAVMSGAAALMGNSFRRTMAQAAMAASVRSVIRYIEANCPAQETPARPANED